MWDLSTENSLEYETKVKSSGLLVSSHDVASNSWMSVSVQQILRPTYLLRIKVS